MLVLDLHMEGLKGQLNRIDLTVYVVLHLSLLSQNFPPGIMDLILRPVFWVDDICFLSSYVFVGPLC